MRFRSVDLAELDAFAAIGDVETARAYRSYLLSALEAGETLPERWFPAIDDDDRIVGRIVYWSLPGVAEVSLDVFALPWADEERAPFALDFLSSSLELLRSTGVRAVEYEHHEPDPDGHTPARLLDTLSASGFHQARTTIRFELAPVVAVPSRGRVSFEGEADGRSLADFARIIARCTAVGEDTGVTRRRPDHDRCGGNGLCLVERRHARRTDLWRIGRIGDEVVGVILPTANDGVTVLNYVGVVPEHRGRRLVDELLAETARLQAAAGATPVRADSDLPNETMHASFERAGWQPFGRRTTYRLELTN